MIRDSYAYAKRDPPFNKMLFGSLIAGIVLILLIGFAGYKYYHFKTANAVVSGRIVDAYTKTESNSGVYYIVLQRDDGQQEVFTDQDNMFQGKFNSSDVWAQLTQFKRDKQHVTLTVNGLRIPFLSWYRNVIRVRAG